MTFLQVRVTQSFFKQILTVITVQDIQTKNKILSPCSVQYPFYIFWSYSNINSFSPKTHTTLEEEML